MAVHAYYAKSVYQKELLTELSDPKIVDDRLVLSPVLTHAAFALDIWPDCELLEFTSINDAIKQLKAHSLRWYYYGSRLFRRGALVAEGLKLVKQEPIEFHGQATDKKFAVFTLLSEHELLICLKPWKKNPLGETEFIENKIVPPNRAYLKLWEALTLLGHYPQKGDLAFDLGASPGGWSWVLANCGADVLAIDKAPLEPKIAVLPNIRYQEGSAFAVEPQDFEKVDWICSDIICYPERSLTLIQKWLESGKAKNIICTIKLQGETDWETLKALRAIEGGRLLHLYQNKHELTFLWPFST